MLLRQRHLPDSRKPLRQHLAQRARDSAGVRWTARPLTDSLSLNQSPAWSPDGRWLYYVSNRFGPRDVFAQECPAGHPAARRSG